jgi:uncharacterized protein YbjT (DUF2867 family)
LRVLVTGGSGFIGSGIVARLRHSGHEVIAIVRARNAASRRLPAQLVTLDLATATRPEDWLPHLAGIDAVVNCAGVLQDSPRESTRGVHHESVQALAIACETAGIRRFIHFSAIGVDRDSRTSFSRTKLAGDEALMARDLDWVILRPSVVVGRPAFGGSALMRGLAALPFLPRVPNAGQLQIVQHSDVVRTVEFFLEPSAPAHVALELAGPERLSFAEVVACYRSWLGWGSAAESAIPPILMSFSYRLGDFAGWLGWRPPVRTTARLEMVRGAVGDPSEWTEITGIKPRALRRALEAEPASVQERWFAQLYLLKPLIFVILSLFWIVTGLISLGPGYGIGVGLMEAAGTGAIAAPSVIAGGLVDIAVGIGIAVRRTAKVALGAGIALALYYAVAGTVLIPSLWIEPLGPMLKIWPILVLMLVALAVLEER